MCNGMVILKLPNRIIPSSRCCISIDYSGAETYGSRLKGLWVYEAGRESLLSGEYRIARSRGMDTRCDMMGGSLFQE